MSSPIKLIPRNVAALRRGASTDPNVSALSRSVAGNPVSTQLESGVGNCFPGLECDLRNLERRFFPFLEVDLGDTIDVRSVDVDGVNAALTSGTLTAASAQIYRLIAADLAAGRVWRIRSLQGTFGPLGQRTLTISSLSPGTNGDPPDAWTAVRLLTESTPVTLTLKRGSMSRTLTAPRARYLDDNGALAAMFLPGELTQSLCSPWTHDFRDCGCFYWASNHPDIAQPPLPPSGTPTAQWNAEVSWERADRNTNVLPAPATNESSELIELDYYEINARWQELNFVLEGRENIGPYSAQGTTATPFPNAAILMTQLRYAAGVELAVMQTYLTSAFSFRTNAPAGVLRDDIAAARAELMRIAIGEMRHLRAVNDVISSLSQRSGQIFVPALRVARTLPDQAAPWQPQAATPQAIAAYIDLEAPSKSVDGLYARIAATLERDGTEAERQTIKSVIAEGEDHYETFLFIQEWLGRHAASDYLIKPALVAPPAANAAHVALQKLYLQTLQHLHNGYLQGLPAGAAEINQARTDMVAQPNGLMPTLQKVANAGFLVVFDAIADARFAPMDRP